MLQLIVLASTSGKRAGVAIFTQESLASLRRQLQWVDKSDDANPTFCKDVAFSQFNATNTPSSSWNNRPTMAPKTPRLEYSPHKRTRIRMMYELGYTQRRIAFEESIPLGSVSGIISRYGQQSSAKNSPRSGRPPKLSNRDKKAIFRIINQDPFISTKDLVNYMQVSLSERTIVRWLKSEGIQHQLAIQRPLLTPKAAKIHYKFALRYRDKSTSF